MKVFVVRHGQTLWNIQNKVCGITDIGLTQKGVEQANKLARIVKQYEIDQIITSPLVRAIKTSEIIADFCKINISVDKRLIEQNYGIYEGVDRNNENFLNNKKNFAYKYPNGESMMQVAYRVYELIDEIKEKYQNRKVLLVSHGGVCRIVNTYFNDMTNVEFFNYKLDNGEIVEYDL